MLVQRRLVLVGGFVFGLIAALVGAEERGSGGPALRWFKGNLHAHSSNSDGDSPPSVVAAWYQSNGYDFLSITDHNFITDPGSFSFAGPRPFLLIPGEEVTDGVQSKPVHLNAVNLNSYVAPSGGTDVWDCIQRNVDRIRTSGAIPILNHPNFRWAVEQDVLVRLRDLRLIEIYNGHPWVNNRGGGGRSSVEQGWDVMLTAGIRVWGVAVDDAHSFKSFSRRLSNPGRGWVMVRAGALSSDAIVSALEAGQFYASTGVELEDIGTSELAMTISIKAEDDYRYTTYFIGESGQTLLVSDSNPAVYEFRGNEKYVRARVEASSGDNAWVQPVFPQGGAGVR